MALKPISRSEQWIKSGGTPTDQFASIIEDLIREIEDMATNAQLFITRPATTAATAVYTAPTSAQGGRGTIIKQFSASDPAGAATFEVNIGTAATASTLVAKTITATAVGVSVSALFDALLKPGDSIYVKCSAGNTIVFCCSGNERRN